MKTTVQLTDKGIVVSLSPEELAWQQRRQQLQTLLAKPAPTLADVMKVLQTVLDGLERLEARLNGD